MQGGLGDHRAVARVDRGAAAAVMHRREAAAAAAEDYLVEFARECTAQAEEAADRPAVCAMLCTAAVVVAVEAAAAAELAHCGA